MEHTSNFSHIEINPQKYKTHDKRCFSKGNYFYRHSTLIAKLTWKYKEYQCIIFPRAHKTQLSTLHYTSLLDIIYHYQPCTLVHTDIHTLFYESLQIHDGIYPSLQQHMGYFHALKFVCAQTQFSISTTFSTH